MSATALETYLAQLYTDKALRSNFLADPEHATREAGLSDADVLALRSIDTTGLRMAVASYANKREQHRRPRRKFLDMFSQWWARQSAGLEQKPPKETHERQQ